MGLDRKPASVVGIIRSLAAVVLCWLLVLRMNGFKSTIVIYEPKPQLFLNPPIRPKIKVEIIRFGTTC